jgi:protein-S-isoprenylcysteine O-methyltransferase Ste14
MREQLLNLGIPALWVAWGLYWWASALDVKHNQRRENVASRLGHIVPLVIAAVLLTPDRLPLGPFQFLAQRMFPGSIALYLGSVVLTAAGLLFTVWARIHLGRNWSGTVTVKQDHELVDNGPYRYVRHPIYTGLLVAFVGSALARNEWRGVLAVLIVFVALWRKLRLEERWMIETFGAAYLRYRQRVAALIPALL